jgi:hypothetical protein
VKPAACDAGTMPTGASAVNKMLFFMRFSTGRERNDAPERAGLPARA